MAKHAKLTVWGELCVLFLSNLKKRTAKTVPL